MIKLGANILSQTVQRNLGRATLDLSTTSERLASGQRINKASDDAAGLAIAASLNVNARIFTQGVRNLNDGLSAVNIAEGAMSELGNIIIRVEELATQSMSSTYSDTQRQALQKEATALTAEWNRIVESTSFNGQNLLTGASTRTVLQGGKGTEGTLAVQIGEAQKADAIEGSAGGTTLVSVSSSGALGNGGSYAPQGSISADGRYVTFNSAASNLVAGDTNGTMDAFMSDTVTGITTRISTSATGVEGNDTSYAAAISADGRYITFYSIATNLVANDTNGAADTFIKDTVTGEVERVSTSSDGSQSSGSASYPMAMSPDGRYVAIYSEAANLVSGDTNGVGDGFVKDRVTGSMTRVTTSSSGLEGNGYSVIRNISANGRYVVFFSAATNLVSGDTNGFVDSFVKDTVTGTTTRISTDSNGNEAAGLPGTFSQVRAISADGRYVGFRSSATNLVAGDTNGVVDSFVKDLVTGTTTRISTDSSGNQGDAASLVHFMSSDGRYVLFESASTNLVQGDTNLSNDAFIKDTLTGITTRVSTDNLGRQVSGSRYPSSHAHPLR
jgi:flagellin-like hook-associated protein FlgL